MITCVEYLDQSPNAQCHLELLQRRRLRFGTPVVSVGAEWESRVPQCGILRQAVNQMLSDA